MEVLTQGSYEEQHLVAGLKYAAVAQDSSKREQVDCDIRYFRHVEQQLYLTLMKGAIMGGQVVCLVCSINLHRSNQECPQCSNNIYAWKCGSCGMQLSKTDDRCHQYHPQAYDLNGSNFERLPNTLNPWKY